MIVEYPAKYVDKNGEEITAIRNEGTSSYFEDELYDLQRQLPDDNKLKCCFMCAFSGYLPGGNGAFGCLACFRDDKEAYLNVKSKNELFQIWNTMTEFVQETYLCPEFELAERVIEVK